MGRGARLTTGAFLLIASVGSTCAVAAAAPRAIHRPLALTRGHGHHVTLARTVASTGVTLSAAAPACARRTPIRLSVRVDRGRPKRVLLATAATQHVVAAGALPAGRHRITLTIEPRSRRCARVVVRGLALSGPVPAAVPPPAAPRAVPLGAALNATAALQVDPGLNSAFLGHFDSLTPENAMKMAYVEPRRHQFDWGDVDGLVKFAAAHGKSVRGHPLLWYGQLPGWLTKGVYSADDMTSIIKEWVNAMVGRYRGRVAVWDVVNEPFDATGSWRASPYYKALGEDFVKVGLQAAHDADPAAKLAINEYDVEQPGPKQTALLNLVRDLKDAGAPLDTVAIQAHWDVSDAPTDGLLDVMRKLVALGVHVEISELDVTTDQRPDALQRQADVYAAAGRDCEAVAQCDRVTVWGVSDRDSWRGAGERPLLFDAAFNAKPAYFALTSALDHPQ